MRTLRFAVNGLLSVCFLLCAATILTASRADSALYPPAPGDPTIDIVAADHGIHVALILPRADVASIASERGLPSLIAVATRFSGFDNLEFGWGDEAFYRVSPAFDRATMVAAIRALTGMNSATVMYALGSVGDPATIYHTSNPVHLRLSREGFARLLTELDRGFDVSAGQPTVLGQGQFGASLFYRGVGQYSLANVCNHWTARLLAKAGVPVAPVVDTISSLFMRDLEWRAGATPAL